MRSSRLSCGFRRPVYRMPCEICKKRDCFLLIAKTNASVWIENSFRNLQIADFSRSGTLVMFLEAHPGFSTAA